MNIGKLELVFRKRDAMKVHLSEATQKFLTSKEDSCSPNTLVDYSRTMRRLSEFISTDPCLIDVTDALLQKFLHLYPGGGKNKRNAYICLSSFYTFCKKKKYVDLNIVREYIEPPGFTVREIDPFSRYEVELILGAINAANCRRDRAIILLLLDTGIRATELCTITMDKIDIDQIHVLGKMNKYRSVPLSTECLQVINDYCQTERHNLIPELFQTDDGKSFDRSNLSHTIHEIGERAEVADCHAHRFRHTFAVNYLINHGDSLSLQKILGHTSLDMVKRYVEFTESDICKIHAKASPVKNWQLVKKR